MQRERVSVIEVCAARAAALDMPPRRQGLVAGKAAAFIIEWSRMMRDLEVEDPTVADFQRWAHVPHRTAWSRVENFRLLFPEHRTPTPVAAAVNEGRSRRETLPVGLIPAA